MLSFTKQLVFSVVLISQLFFFVSCEETDDTNDGTPMEEGEECLSSDTSTVKDSDGNTYVTIKVGDQWWMAENLRSTKYNDGTAIPIEPESLEWGASTRDGGVPLYCWYDNDSSTYKNPYGALYNWYVVETEKICPVGWHVPSDDEWEELEVTLGMDPVELDEWGYRGTNEGYKLKSTSGWKWEGNGSNEVCFNAYPSGERVEFSSFVFNDITENCLWWTSTESKEDKAIDRSLHQSGDRIGRNSEEKREGKSIRCVKD